VHPLWYIVCSETSTLCVFHHWTPWHPPVHTLGCGSPQVEAPEEKQNSQTALRDCHLREGEVHRIKGAPLWDKKKKMQTLKPKLFFACGKFPFIRGRGTVLGWVGKDCILPLLVKHPWCLWRIWRMGSFSLNPPRFPDTSGASIIGTST
jgi:hypothetical protein